MEEIDEKGKDIDFNLGYVKLHYNDLVKVIDILKKTGSEKIRITTDRFKLFSDELEKLKKKPIRFMTIETQDSLILRLGEEFSDDGAIIRSWDNSEKYLGIAHRLREFLITKRRKFISLFRFSWVVYTLIFLLVFVTGFLQEFASGQNFLYLNYVSFVLLLVTIFYITVHILVMKRKIKGNQIIMVDKDDLPNFWIRNKDRLIAGTIVAIISAIITFLITINFI